MKNNASKTSKILVLCMFNENKAAFNDKTDGFDFTMKFSGYTFDQLKDLNQVIVAEINDDELEQGCRDRYTCMDLSSCLIDVDDLGNAVATWDSDEINDVHEGEEVPIELFTLIDRNPSDDGATPVPAAAIYDIAEDNGLYFYIEPSAEVTVYRNGSKDETKEVKMAPTIELSSDVQDALMHYHQGMMSLTEAVIRLHDYGVHICHLSHVANKDKTIAVVQLPYAETPTAWYELTADYGLKTDDDWPLLNRLVVAI